MGKLPLAITGIIGAGGAATIGGYSIYSIMQPKTIKEKLLKEGFKLVSDIKDSSQLDKAWEKMVSRYKVEADSDSKINSESVDTITKDKIFNWCSSNLNSKIESALYSKASKWCVTFISLEEKLIQGSKKLNTDAPTLNNKYNSIPPALQAEINKMGVTDNPPNTNGEKTKKWCSDLSKRAFVSEQDDHYKNLINYCI